MEISIVILSCVILGLNPEMPVFFILFIMICNLNGFRQIKYIHTWNNNNLSLITNMTQERDGYEKLQRYTNIKLIIRLKGWEPEWSNQQNIVFEIICADVFYLYKNRNKNLTKLFTAIVHIMTSILCYVIIYEKVTNTCAKNRQYL